MDRIPGSRAKTEKGILLRIEGGHWVYNDLVA